MQVLTSEKLPIKLWADEIEEGALQQAKNLANFPFASSHIALMPDVHQGYGMPIGGIMATKGVVVPNAVGVDIGCGMCAVRTKRQDMSRDEVKCVMGKIPEVVPVGFNKHEKPQEEWLDYTDFAALKELTGESVVYREYEKSTYQIGTLGGGNHFIELQMGNDGFIWVMVHSGSRNLGKQVADHYNKLAKLHNERWASAVPASLDLAFLPLASEEGAAYLLEMEYCVDFALTNRLIMMNRIEEALGEEFSDIINIAHNYARIERWRGEQVVVHRKGATSARKGELGIIPGSQGSASYIVCGKGSAESFASCSHGAGRRMGRKEAQRSLRLEDEKKRLDDLGVVHGIRSEKDLDEAAGAYKDIGEVMLQQRDLVEVLVKLRPLGVVKG